MKNLVATLCLGTGLLVALGASSKPAEPEVVEARTPECDCRICTCNPCECGKQPEPVPEPTIHKVTVAKTLPVSAASLRAEPASSCSSGSCGPVRGAVRRAAQPVRRVFQRQPIRRFFGRFRR